MTYIIMDIEWNQPVSKNSYPYLKIGDKISNEIIQIGAYKVSEELKIVDSFCAYVKPRYYKKLNSFVKKVTHIDKTAIIKGESFIDAIARFKEWCGEKFYIFTWGTDDVQVMKQNLDFYGIDKSFITNWYDMQMIFSMSQLKENIQKSLQFAIEFMGIGKDADKNFHDALSDAYYTTQIFVRHDIDMCIANYGGTSDFADMCSELDDTSFGSFSTKNKAMTDKYVTQTICPLCCELMKKHGGWLSVNGKYICLATCENHGDFITRIKINKHLDGKFYVNKIIKKASIQMSDDIKKKYAHTSKKSFVKHKQRVNAL